MQMFSSAGAAAPPDSLNVYVNVIDVTPVCVDVSVTSGLGSVSELSYT